MAYIDSDTAHESDGVVELYKFSTDTRTWLYTSYDEALGSYEPLEISRQRVERSDNLLKQDLKLDIPRDSELASEALMSAPEEVLLLTVWQAHVNGVGGNALVFKGRFVSHEMDANILSMSFEPIHTTMKRMGFQAKYQRICRHPLYSSKCGANSAGHTATGTVLSVNKNVVSLGEATGFADGYFTAGYIVTESGLKRMVVNHTGQALELIRPITSLSVGETITVYAGCDHTIATCRDKFDNKDNYGGFDFIPKTNPFGGSQIF